MRDMETVFTDPEAAIEEMEYLAQQEGGSYAVVTVYQVMSYDEARERELPILEVQTR